MSTPAEDKLRKLGERVRGGLDKLHPVSEKQLADVRKAVEEQWQAKQKEREQGPTQSSDVAKEKQKSQEKTQQNHSAKDKSKSQDHGHSH